jgi:hypothetical protein
MPSRHTSCAFVSFMVDELRMLLPDFCECQLRFDLLIFLLRNPWEFNLPEDRERG